MTVGPARPERPPSRAAGPWDGLVAGGSQEYLTPGAQRHAHPQRHTHAHAPTWDELHGAWPGLLLRKGPVAGTQDTQISTGKGTCHPLEEVRLGCGSPGRGVPCRPLQGTRRQGGGCDASPRSSARPQPGGEQPALFSSGYPQPQPKCQVPGGIIKSHCRLMGLQQPGGKVLEVDASPEFGGRHASPFCSRSGWGPAGGQRTCLRGDLGTGLSQEHYLGTIV